MITGNMSLTLEPMTEENLEEVYRLQALVFPEPYSRNLLSEEIKFPLAFPLLLKCEERLVGYLDYWMIQGEAHLIQIGIHPDFRKKGWGSFLMQYLERIALEKKLSKIYLDVRQSNAAARRLYEKFGFKTTGVRKAYYADNREDALLMEKSIQPLSQNPEASP